MMDEFFTKTKCDRCGGSLSEGRIMSMFNTDCLCLNCKEKEKNLPGYEEACKKDIEEYRKRITYSCCICGKMFTGYGNNPYPIKTDGRCCDECDKKVIEARMLEAVKNR